MRLIALALSLSVSVVWASGSKLGVDPNEALASKESCLDSLITATTDWKPAEGHGTPEVWDFDGFDGAKYYNIHFEELFQIRGVRSILDILKKRGSSGKSNHVLDLFGSGFVVENRSDADSVTGLRFGSLARESADKRKQTLLSQLPENPPEVLGDAMNPETWRHLKESMGERGIPAMDLVTMRPMGGWQSQPFSQNAESNALAVSLMVKNVLEILSQDGEFYFYVQFRHVGGDYTNHPVLKKLLDQVEEDTAFRLKLQHKVDPKRNSDGLAGVLYPK